MPPAPKPKTTKPVKTTKPAPPTAMRADSWAIVGEGVGAVMRRDQSRSARPTPSRSSTTRRCCLCGGGRHGARIAEQPPATLSRSDLIVDVGTRRSPAPSEASSTTSNSSRVC